MAELMIPIKVKIVRAPDGSHGFPPFNQIVPALRGNKDWSKFFDSHGLGWHYDRLSGFGESDLDNPEVDNAHPHANPDPDSWYGATVIPEGFANAAVAKWPDRVSIITEEEFESFYDDRAHVHEEQEILDVDALQGIHARILLEEHPDAPTKPPSAAILAARAKCLDPDAQSHRGIRKNLRRRWADFKTCRPVNIHPDQAKPSE